MTTLIGLMMRGPIDFSLPPQETISDYGARSDALLEELHQAMLMTCPDLFSPDKLEEPDFNPFKYGEVLREAIFYGGESAYTFQYRDLAPAKYGADADWLKRNKGIELDVAREVCQDIATLLNARLMDTLTSLRDKPPAEWTMLDGFTFSSVEITARIGRPIESVRAVVEAFTALQDERNVTFKSLHDFNSAYAYPFIRRGPDEFVLLQQYGIAEALYETPFYWMRDDKAYCDTALRHRGDFTESFAAERLTHVFGAGRVFQNVEIFKQKGQALGEIDVLVLFGNRAIVLQAKSKKLTLQARQGNDLQLQTDFKAAVQDAVDQAIACAEFLGDPSVTLRCREGAVVPLTEPLRAVFPVTIVVDHYPALAFQARQFLAAKTSDPIAAPLVTDIFALDAMTEMLSSPLRLVSYLSSRARFGDKLMMSHEHTVLSYHLKRNLWLKEDIDGVVLQDDISMELDIAMAARRDGIAGARTPDGILTHLRGTHFSRIIDLIEDEPAPAAIDLGLMLLELSEDTVRDLNQYVTRALASTAADGQLHDATIAVGSSGLTIHCSRLPRSEAEFRLRSHCTMRKYLAKASSWFGLALALDGSIGFIAELLGRWKFHPALEAACAASSMRPMNGGSKKAGRNDPCPCGSGKKYKRCCLRRY